MTKSEFITSLTKRQSQLPDTDIEMAINTLLKYMGDVLAEGKRIEIRGFGVFQTSYRRARIGRNPKTGDSVSIPGKYVPTFKPGTILSERVNDSFLEDMKSV